MLMQNLQMKPQLCKLLWEEETFGIKAAKINLDNELTKEQWYELNKEFKDYEMIVINNCGNNSKNNLLIGELNNCFLADINVQFEKIPSHIDKDINTNVKIVNNKNFDDIIIKIAEESFIYSRFTNDPNLDREKAKLIYVDWTRNSFNKEKKYFVTYEEDNKNIGFIVFSINGSVAIIELVAVDKQYQNRKIGKAMIVALERFLIEEKSGVNIIKVGTQAENESAIMFYQNRGFKLVKVNTIYHCWDK